MTLDERNKLDPEQGGTLATDDDDLLDDDELDDDDLEDGEEEDADEEG